MAAEPEDVAGDDPLRTRLLDAAARIFASEGYAGTRIADIVADAGLSTGSVYGRFGSKNDLLHQAVVRQAAAMVDADTGGVDRVLARLLATGPLDDDEALRVEALVAARREPEVAEALLEADQVRTARLQPFFDAAVRDGSIGPATDPATVMFLVRTVHLGLMLQRAAGSELPDGEAWERLVLLLAGAVAGDPAS